jgi:hypothetical protein
MSISSTESESQLRLLIELLFPKYDTYKLGKLDQYQLAAFFNEALQKMSIPAPIGGINAETILKKMDRNLDGSANK